MKVRVHTSYIGKTSYAYHARHLFREFAKYVDLRVHNFSWDDDVSYLIQVDKDIVDSFSLRNEDDTYVHWNTASYSMPGVNWKHKTFDGFEADIDLVLATERHYYFYEEYKAKIKIAFCVWESTLLNQYFFETFKTFDYFIVCTEWHKKMLINQGIAGDRIFIIHQAAPDYFDPFYRTKRDDKFQFLLFGRWDYRKSTKEIIETFNETFKNIDDVELVLNVDNVYAEDGLETTENRLKYFGLESDKLKIERFMNRQTYINYMNNADCFVSCSRSEGWNIPLNEAMNAGIPVIYSNYGAQLEFTKGKGLPVDIEGLRPCSYSRANEYKNVGGLFCEPNFNMLKEALLDVYSNRHKRIEEAIEISRYTKSNFNWEKSGRDLYEILKQLM